MTEVPEWERIKDLLVAIDARLRAFTDREVKYYLQEGTTTVTINVFTLIPKLDKAALLKVTVGRLDLLYPTWDADRMAHCFIDAWIEKMKMERRYEELNVIFDSPPSWAVNALEEKENHIVTK